jgi:hypothetical protein
MRTNTERKKTIAKMAGSWYEMLISPTTRQGITGTSIARLTARFSMDSFAHMIGQKKNPAFAGFLINYDT